MIDQQREDGPVRQSSSDTSSSATDGDSKRTPNPSFAEAFRFWLKLGLISFGGPTGQIAIMQTELVDRKRWISQSRFLHALNYCMLLPGPEAQQLATYIGWLLHKTAGGIVAGALFVIPSIFVLWTLSYIYAAYGSVPWIAAIFYGLKPVVVAIVTAAVIRIGRKTLKNEVMWAIAALAFISIFFFGAPFPAIIIGAGLLGLVGGKFWPAKFDVISTDHGSNKPETENSVIDDAHAPPEHTRPSIGRAARVAILWLAIWWTPVLVAGVLFGTGHTIFREGIFFSKAAVVTFGGAYAVLPYVAQHAVEPFHWLKPGQMMDGLGLAETTPGPLIMVLQFVGFMGGWNQPGQLSPLVAATLGALITTWVTFTPCFLWVFLGGPHIEQLRGNKRIAMTLSAVTAAVVGVVLNLAVWFALHVIHPEIGFDWLAIALGVAALIAMLRWKLGVIPVILAGGVIGLIISFLR
ncbi:MAG: chromate transporter [Verrucomicrobia bacterium]|nr:MAG: chromate transporter [Verrucomicrobiota bacterium]